MSKWSFEGSFRFSGREYAVKVSGDPKTDGVGAISRGGSAVAVFRRGDDAEPWVFLAGRPKVFEAALAVLPA